MDSKLIKSGLAALGVLVSVSGAQAAVDKDAIAERLAPVGEVCLASQDCGSASSAPAASSSDDSGAADGEGIYGKVCSVCHDAGVAGAPVRGDEDQWAARTDKGLETLLDHAINGFNAMPARGGNPSLSDDDMHAAVAYMVEPVMDVPEAESAGDDAADADTAKDDSAAAEEEAADAAAADDANEDSAAGESAWASIDGEAIFDSACMACHATGAAGAPVVGNADAWAPHIEKGTDTLYDHAINGFNAMPAKGGRTDLSDDEVKASVDYMVENSQ